MQPSTPQPGTISWRPVRKSLKAVAQQPWPSGKRAFVFLKLKQEFCGITVTELNPDHGEEELATLKFFSRRFAQAMAGRGYGPAPLPR
jgi:hypothetical protein